MVRRLALAAALGLWLTAGTAASAAPAPPTTHQVEKGQHLGGIAKRYGISLAALLRANGLQRKTPIRPGQRLLIPGKDDPDGEKAAAEREAAAERASPAARAAAPGIQSLPVAGSAPAYYFEPTGPGRAALRPVIVYLHGRGGNPAADCQRWSPIVRRLGWLLCPSGPEDRGGGARGWNNTWYSGQPIVERALGALRQRYGRRVQLQGNTLIGFSEGAYVAMNLGVRAPRVFNRWLILAADADYWGGAGVLALKENRKSIKRVYLVTGEQDGVFESTQQVRAWLERERIATRVSLPHDLGHELALGTKPAMYRAALEWLANGDPPPPRRRTAKR